MALACLGLATALPQSTYSINEEDYATEDIITRDVVVVGGGSGGTYAATRLVQLGQSVVLIEKEPVLGGMTNTYVVPGSGVKIDYGVIFFHNITIVQNYFDYYDVPLSAISFSPSGTTYNVDLTTGDVYNGAAGNETAAVLALEAYLVQLNKYPYLTAGLNLAYPVPEDLLIPFKDFVAKYDLSPMVPFTQLGGGYADIINQPTLYTMKLLGNSLAQSVLTGFVSTAARDNGALYEAAAAKFAAVSSLLLSSTILHVARNYDGKGTAALVIRTPTGAKLIKASKIVVAFPPRLSNFPGWDLDDTESDVFGTYTNEAYYNTLLNGTGIPDSVTVNNVGADTLFNLPIFPGVDSFNPTVESGLFNADYTSPYAMSEEHVKGNITAALARLNIPGVMTTPEMVEWVEFKSHTPFFEHVTGEQIQNGFYKKAMALQGHRGTWYTGAAWETHDSSMIWNFTETILGEIVSGNVGKL